MINVCFSDIFLMGLQKCLLISSKKKTKKQIDDRYHVVTHLDN